MELSNDNTIPGTLNDSTNLILSVSSGIPSLDDLLGNGLPVGTITLIEEDTRGLYGRIMLKYFLAEGVVNKHEIFVSAEDLDPRHFITQLPALIESKSTRKGVSDDDDDIKSNDNDGDENKRVGDSTINNIEKETRKPKRKMKIAFRYDNLPTKEKESIHKFGHYYDLSLVMPKKILEGCKIFYWKSDAVQPSNNFFNPMYQSLLNKIKSYIEDNKFNKICKDIVNNILRIGIHSLGSPLWFSDHLLDEKHAVKDLTKFLYCLRGLLTRSRALAMVTIPSHLYEQISRCRHVSDLSIRLQSLAGTELEENKYLSDYHGYFHVDKMDSINSFKSAFTETEEYMFKLRRKKFIIEKLHLPPGIEVTDTKRPPSLGCGSSTKHLLEF